MTQNGPHSKIRREIRIECPMRKSFSYWILAAAIGLSTVGTGCRSGTGWTSPSWLSWGSKSSAPATPSAVASRPNTQLPPSPSATMSPNSSYANSSTTPNNSPYGKTYGAQQTSATPSTGYYTGQYNTGASNGTAPAGGYGSAASTNNSNGYGTTAPAGGYPTTSSRSPYPTTGAGAPASYGAPPTNYGAPPTNYGAANSPASPASPSTYPATPSGGAAAYQAMNTGMPGANSASRDGGYRPGSTGRSVTADGTLRNPPTIQPADYQSGAPANESVPEYSPAPAPPAGYGGGTFIPPSGQ